MPAYPKGIHQVGCLVTPSPLCLCPGEGRGGSTPAAGTKRPGGGVQCAGWAEGVGPGQPFGCSHEEVCLTQDTATLSPHPFPTTWVGVGASESATQVNCRVSME